MISKIFHEVSWSGHFAVLHDTNTPGVEAWSHICWYMGMIVTAIHLSNSCCDVDKSIQVVMFEFSILREILAGVGGVELLRRSCSSMNCSHQGRCF